VAARRLRPAAARRRADRHREVESRRRGDRARSRAGTPDPLGLRAYPAHAARSARACRARRDRDEHARHRLGGPRRRGERADPARARPARRAGLDRLDQRPLRTVATGDIRMNPILDFAVSFASLCFVSAMLFSLVRLFLGPAAQDRVLALDTFYLNGMLILLTLGIRSRSLIYFDMALLIALFGFVGTIALSKFLLRGEVIEP